MDLADPNRRFMHEGKLWRVRSRVADAAHYVFYLFDDALLYASEDRTQVLPPPSSHPGALSRILNYTALKYAHGESMRRGGTGVVEDWAACGSSRYRVVRRCGETAQLTRHAVWRPRLHYPSPTLSPTDPVPRGLLTTLRILHPMSTWQVGGGGALNLKRKFNIGNGQGGKIAVPKSREGGQVPPPLCLSACPHAACRVLACGASGRSVCVAWSACLVRVTWHAWARGAGVWSCASGAVCLPCVAGLRSLSSHPWHPFAVCYVGVPAGALPCARATCTGMH